MTFCTHEKQLVIFPQAESLSHASKVCETHGGSLVVPQSEEENRRVLKLLVKHKTKCMGEALTESCRRQLLAGGVGDCRLCPIDNQTSRYSQSSAQNVLVSARSRVSLCIQCEFPGRSRNDGCKHRLFCLLENMKIQRVQRQVPQRVMHRKT